MSSFLSFSRRPRAGVLAAALPSAFAALLIWVAVAQASISDLKSCSKLPSGSAYLSMCRKHYDLAQKASKYSFDMKDFPECTSEDKGLQQQCAIAVSGARMLKEWYGLVAKQRVETRDDPQCAANRDAAIAAGYTWEVSCVSLTPSSSEAWLDIGRSDDVIGSNAIAVAAEANFYPKTFGGPNLPDRTGGQTSGAAWDQLRAWQSATQEWWNKVAGIPVGDQKIPCWDAMISLGISYGPDSIKETQDLAAKCISAVDATLPGLLAVINGSLVKSENEKYCPPDSPPGTICPVNPLSTTEVPTIVGHVINTALGILGSLALLMFIYGGVTWLTAYGSTEKIQKGKDIMVWALLGMLLIFGSFALVRFVLGAFTRL